MKVPGLGLKTLIGIFPWSTVPYWYLTFPASHFSPLPHSHWQFASLRTKWKFLGNLSSYKWVWGFLFKEYCQTGLGCDSFTQNSMKFSWLPAMQSWQQHGNTRTGIERQSRAPQLLGARGIPAMPPRKHHGTAENAERCRAPVPAGPCIPGGMWGWGCSRMPAHTFPRDLFTGVREGFLKRSGMCGMPRSPLPRLRLFQWGAGSCFSWGRGFGREGSCCHEWSSWTPGWRGWDAAVQEGTDPGRGVRDKSSVLLLGWTWFTHMWSGSKKKKLLFCSPACIPLTKCVFLSY